MVGLVAATNDSNVNITAHDPGNGAPVVYCYSLIYVYYDQYTYITGILSQSVVMAIVVVFVCIQVSNIFSYDSLFLIFCFIHNIDFKQPSYFRIYHSLRIFGIL